MGNNAQVPEARAESDKELVELRCELKHLKESFSKEAIVQAIKDANACLDAGEGVGLLYYMSPDFGEEVKVSRELIAVILSLGE